VDVKLEQWNANNVIGLNSWWQGCFFLRFPRYSLEGVWFHQRGYWRYCWNQA
jgi:hypothetical protein